MTGDFKIEGMPFVTVSDFDKDRNLDPGYGEGYNITRNGNVYFIKNGVIIFVGKSNETQNPLNGPAIWILIIMVSFAMVFIFSLIGIAIYCSFKRRLQTKGREILKNCTKKEEQTNCNEEISTSKA